MTFFLNVLCCWKDTVSCKVAKMKKSKRYSVEEAVAFVTDENFEGFDNENDNENEEDFNIFSFSSDADKVCDDAPALTLLAPGVAPGATPC